MLDVGQVISGKYKLLRLLGDGGMGAVYEAEHLGLGTHVAVKVLHHDLVRRTGLIERFLQEARVSAQIRSAHVVQVTDVEKTPEGIAYLVMELLRGEPLSNLLRREKRLTVATALEYGQQILTALESAHALGVVHRDLKPDNVFVTFAAGRPVLKLIDFGIAKLRAPNDGTTKSLTVAGMLMGTPEYMAPEQLYAADKVDVRADLYSVGCMLYEMLSGQTPTSGDDPRVVVLKAERGEVTPLVHAAPGVPPEVAGLVHRAMAPRPELRFANATEMRIAMESLASGKRDGATYAEPPRGGKGSTHALAAPLAGSVAPPPLVSGSAGSDGASGGVGELGTGTVMGAPAASALASVIPSALASTVKAAPVVASHTQMGQAAAPSPPVSSYVTSEHAPRRTKKRGGRGLMVGLALVALLLGAGAVVAYVASTSDSVPSVPSPFPTSPPPSTAPPAATSATTAAAASPTVAPPLAPGPAQTSQPSTPTRPPPTASGSGAPSATPPPSGTASTPAPGIPPFTLPSALPSGFPTSLPTSIPLPSGFPMPSGLPTMWPPPAPAPVAPQP